MDGAYKDDDEDLNCNEGVAVKSMENEHTLPHLVTHPSSVNPEGAL